MNEKTGNKARFPLVAVAGTPPIAGLDFRRFRGEADYPIMVAILDARNAADDLDYVNTVEEVAGVFAHLTNCDPERDMLGDRVIPGNPGPVWKVAKCNTRLRLSSILVDGEVPRWSWKIEGCCWTGPS